MPSVSARVPLAGCVQRCQQPVPSVASQRPARDEQWDHCCVLGLLEVFQQEQHPERADTPKVVFVPVWGG